MVNELITIIDHIGAYAINYGLQNISTLSKIKTNIISYIKDRCLWYYEIGIYQKFMR